MKLEQQVTSLELSKKLKELGVKQDSLFWWVEYTDGHGKEQLWSIENSHAGYKQFVSAFTVAELGEMLPAWVGSRKTTIGYECNSQHIAPNAFFGEATEADARAKMLIYLIENKLITL